MEFGMIPVVIWYEYHTPVFAVYEMNDKYSTPMAGIRDALCY